ncbi:hypothetical protein IV38_GL001374 [Lactobacillus selangorensis]|uniref:SCP domain-containing protein n=1 Tax=Lactobacillus selangorensis TaxID=81857 RepID=A0A0R2G4Z8_9LACO|nr:CAP domain-containing protein [Lactobacillus selangorensis]KRN28375.1 hypothetical protein IV38_GL001374 [Lactobacillus selangorensis]KRN31876.1 hypothetical protein IV40_GL001161 [Lactobacillus selangorensis]
MNKKNNVQLSKKWLVTGLASSALLVGGVMVTTATPTHAATIENVSGIQTTKITAASGAVLYRTPATNGTVVKSVAVNSSWRVLRQTTAADGTTWYDLGGNQWVQAAETTGLQLVGGQPQPTAMTNAVATTTTSAVLYNGYGSNASASGRVLTTGSRWKVSNQVTVNGTTWYEVGGNQWITSGQSTLAANQTNSSNSQANVEGTTATQAQTVTVHANGATLYNGYGTSAVASRSLSAYSAWKVGRTTTVNNVTWYEIGANQWVNSNEITGANDFVPNSANMAAVENRVIELINQLRASKGLSQLTLNSQLQVLSYNRANVQRTRGSLDEHAGWKSALDASGYYYSVAGENLVQGLMGNSVEATAQEAFNLWKNSPGHYANMVNPKYTNIGLTILPDSDGYRDWGATEFGC